MRWFLQRPPWADTRLELFHARTAQAILFLLCLIPLSLALNDGLRGETGDYGAYSLAVVGLLVEVLFIDRRKQAGSWRPLFVATLLGSIPLTVLAGQSYFIEVAVFLCSVPILFQMFGVRAGALWGLVVVAEFGLLWLLADLGWIPNWVSRYPPSLMPVLVATAVVLGALVWSLTALMEKSFAERLEASLFDIKSGWPRRRALDHELGLVDGRPAVLALVQWDNAAELTRLLDKDSLENTAKRVRQWVSTVEGLQVYHIRDHQFALYLGPQAPSPLELHNAIEGLDFRVGTWPYRILATIGSTDKAAGSDPEAYNRADRALGAALEARVPWIHEGPGDRPDDGARLWIERHAVLSRNLELGLCRVHFQPVVDANTLEPRWYEALARIQTSEGTTESIFPYLPVAEAAGLLPRLTRTVWEQALAFVDSGNAGVSVNLTLQDLGDESLLAVILDDVARRPRGKFILELLERDHFTDAPGVKRFVQRAIAAGCRIALDDFGSGYSNFGTLSELELHIVKIDGALAKASSTDPKAMALIRAMVQFCHETGLEVVAEHIDDETMVELYRAVGVEYLQGYHVGKPSPASPDQKTYTIVG